jgi:MFS family permease
VAGRGSSYALSTLERQSEEEKQQWAPLREPVFRAFWLAAFASNVGSWMQSVAAAWLMTTLTPSPLLAALVQSASTLPLFLLGLPAGAFADLYDRRRVLLWTQSAMLGAALALSVLAMTGHAGPLTLLLLTFAMGIGAAFNAPAWAATIPELVRRKDDLPAAVTLNSVQFNAARAVGPAIGGLLLLTASAGVIFLVNAVSFLGVIAVIWGWRRAAGTGVSSNAFVPFVRDGVRFVAHDAVMRRILFRALVFVINGSALWALLPSIAKHIVRTDGGGFGLMMGTLGVGAVLSGAILSRGHRRQGSEERLLIWGTGGFGLAIAGLALCDGRLWLAFPVLLVGGISWMTMMSTLSIAAQFALPDAFRARGLSIYIICFNGSMALGSWAWGHVAEVFSLEHALWAAAGCLGISLVVGRGYGVGRQLG